jgi:hypothetical protein
MNTNERDVYYIAFEGDSMYFHCPSKTVGSVQWHFLSFNYYLMKTLPTLYDKDTKINSVKINDAGMYICQTESMIYKRIILTIIRENIEIILLKYFIDLFLRSTDIT